MRKLLFVLLFVGCEDPNLSGSGHSGLSASDTTTCQIDWLAACVDVPELRTREECRRYEELWASPDMLAPPRVVAH